MAYERVNEKVGRLFRASEEDLKKGRPLLNGMVMIDGILCYAGLRLKKGSQGKADYYTLSLDYPPDETARLRADGPATSAAAKRENEWQAAHPRTNEDEHRRAEWQKRRDAERAAQQRPAEPVGLPDDDPGGFPF